MSASIVVKCNQNKLKQPSSGIRASKLHVHFQMMKYYMLQIHIHISLLQSLQILVIILTCPLVPKTNKNRLVIVEMKTKSSHMYKV